MAVSDFMRSVPDQVSRWMPRHFTSLGTDGFGRSDTRSVLRRFFEVDAAHVVVAVLSALAGEGALHPGAVREADRSLRDRPCVARPLGDLTAAGDRRSSPTTVRLRPRSDRPFRR